MFCRWWQNFGWYLPRETRHVNRLLTNYVWQQLTKTCCLLITSLPFLISRWVDCFCTPTCISYYTFSVSGVSLMFCSSGTYMYMYMFSRMYKIQMRNFKIQEVPFSRKVKVPGTPLNERPEVSLFSYFQFKFYINPSVLHFHTRIKTKLIFTC